MSGTGGAVVQSDSQTVGQPDSRTAGQPDSRMIVVRVGGPPPLCSAERRFIKLSDGRRAFIVPGASSNSAPDYSLDRLL